jgi:hypothetical protein
VTATTRGAIALVIALVIAVVRERHVASARSQITAATSLGALNDPFPDLFEDRRLGLRGQLGKRTED